MNQCHACMLVGGFKKGQLGHGNKNVIIQQYCRAWMTVKGFTTCVCVCVGCRAMGA